MQTHELVRALFEVEATLSDDSLYSVEDQQALDHFKDTHSREPDGRYVVKLPRRNPLSPLGCSREHAARRFIQNERSLKRKGQLDRFKKQ